MPCSKAFWIIYKNAGKYFARNRGLAKAVARTWANLDENESAPYKKTKTPKIEVYKPETVKIKSPNPKLSCPVCNVKFTESKLKKHLKKIHKGFKDVRTRKSKSTVKSQRLKPPVAKGVFSNCPNCKLAVDVGLLTVHNQKYCTAKIRKIVGRQSYARK